MTDEVVTAIRYAVAVAKPQLHPAGVCNTLCYELVKRPDHHHALTWLVYAQLPKSHEPLLFDLLRLTFQ